MDPYDLATPVPAAMPGGGDESDLVFVTHMPGVSVPPRPAEFEHDEDLQRLAAKLRGEEPPPEEKPSGGRKRAGLTMRLVEGAGKLGRAAGKGALERTLEAGRKSTGSSGMTQMFYRVETRNVAGVVNVVKPQTPSFASLFLGCLVAPLRKGSLPAILGGVVMLAVALLLLELSPLIGLVGLLVAGVELMALRVKYVRAVAHGKDELVWPEWSEVLAALPAYPATLVVFVPALIAGAVALGPSAWSAQQPGSIPRRAAQLLSAGDRQVPANAADLPGAEGTGAWGRTGLVMLEAVLGNPPQGYDPRSPQQVAEDLRKAGTSRLKRWALPSGATPLGWTAWGLFLAAIIAFPMALLAVAKLESGYAALHAPLIVRSILRTVVGYPLVVACFVCQDLVVVLTLLDAQATCLARLGTGLGYLTAVMITSALVVVLPVITGSLLGRFYRSHANELGWEG